MHVGALVKRQFRLRWLFVSVAIVAIITSLTAIKSSQVREQRELIQTVEDLGGVILYEHQSVSDGLHWNYDRRVPTPGPRWLRRLLGDDWFRTPAEIYLRGSRISDETLPPLMRFRNYRGCLFLANTAITSEGLAKLRESLPNASIVP